MFFISSDRKKKDVPGSHDSHTDYLPAELFRRLKMRRFKGSIDSSHFSGIMTEAGQSACLVIVRELLELIQKAAVEYRIDLDFLPEDFQLYEYAKMRNKDKLAASIAGCTVNIIVIEQKKRLETGFRNCGNGGLLSEKNYGQSVSLRTVAADRYQQFLS